MHKPTPAPAKPLADAEREYDAKLAWLLKCAVAVGANESGAVAKAKNARQQYEAAFEELRRAERHRGRLGSVNYINAKMGAAQSSDAAKGDYNADWPRMLMEALADLKRAVW